MECYLAMKRNEILSFAVTWRDWKGIILSEISQTKPVSHVYGIWKKKLVSGWETEGRGAD